MPLQIANPEVVRKVDELAKATGLSKTAAVGRAVDRMLSDLGGDARQADRFSPPCSPNSTAFRNEPTPTTP